jgi:long-subunit acyl-CoA synthetase (AMP-forming)
MIVGSSGENIYPEEIESVINDFSHVIESLVVQKKGKLVAMVHVNLEELQAKYAQMKKDFSDQAEQVINEYLVELQRYVNFTGKQVQPAAAGSLPAGAVPEDSHTEDQEVSLLLIDVSSGSLAG